MKNKCAMKKLLKAINYCGPVRYAVDETLIEGCADIIKDLRDEIASMSQLLLREQIYKEDLRASFRELKDLIDHSPFDTSPCRGCGMDVLCIPDGLPYCEACTNKMDGGKDQS